MGVQMLLTCRCAALVTFVTFTAVVTNAKICLEVEDSNSAPITVKEIGESDTGQGQGHENGGKIFDIHVGDSKHDSNHDGSDKVRITITLVLDGANDTNPVVPLILPLGGAAVGAGISGAVNSENKIGKTGVENWIPNPDETTQREIEAGNTVSEQPKLSETSTVPNAGNIAPALLAVPTPIPNENVGETPSKPSVFKPIAAHRAAHRAGNAIPGLVPEKRKNTASDSSVVTSEKGGNIAPGLTVIGNTASKNSEGGNTIAKNTEPGFTTAQNSEAGNTIPRNTEAGNIAVPEKNGNTSPVPETVSEEVKNKTAGILALLGNPAPDFTEKGKLLTKKLGNKGATFGTGTAAALLFGSGLAATGLKKHQENLAGVGLQETEIPIPEVPVLNGTETSERPVPSSTEKSKLRKKQQPGTSRTNEAPPPPETGTRGGTEVSKEHLQDSEDVSVEEDEEQMNCTCADANTGESSGFDDTLNAGVNTVRTLVIQSISVVGTNFIALGIMGYAIMKQIGTVKDMLGPMEDDESKSEPERKKSPPPAATKLIGVKKELTPPPPPPKKDPTPPPPPKKDPTPPPPPEKEATPPPPPPEKEPPPPPPSPPRLGLKKLAKRRAMKLNADDLIMPSEPTIRLDEFEPVNTGPPPELNLGTNPVPFVPIEDVGDLIDSDDELDTGDLENLEETFAKPDESPEPSPSPEPEPKRRESDIMPDLSMLEFEQPETEEEEED